MFEELSRRRAEVQLGLRNNWNQGLNVARSCPITLIRCSLSVLLFLGQTGFSSQWEALVQWMFLTKERLTNLNLHEF